MLNVGFNVSLASLDIGAYRDGAAGQVKMLNVGFNVSFASLVIGAYQDGAAGQVNVLPHRDNASAQAIIPPSHSILTPGRPVLWVSRP